MSSRFCATRRIAARCPVVSELELLEGCRNRREQRAVEELLNGWFGEIISVDAGVSCVAVRLMQQFGLWHRPGMADVLIAASALETGEVLATSNLQPFSFRPRARDQALQGT